MELLAVLESGYGTAVNPASPVVVGEVLADKYRIDRVLGEGGMGVVVAAHHLELDQPVAIKFLLDNLATSEEGAERFRREARAAAKIQSDHVVRVLDVGLLPNGTRYMVMEYLDGHDLSEELQRSGPLGVERAVAYVLEALDAVGQAHAAGIVHRDLKPANLFLARRADGSSRVKVLDFGISKSMSTGSVEQLSLTRTSAWMGSPLYMAPEQMQSARDVDGRADIWSIGAILYELIAGQPPYQAESLPQLCNLLLTSDPAPLSSVRPDVPAAVNDVVMRCLSRDITRRWQNVPELTAALLDTGVVGPQRSLGRSAVGLASTALASTELASSAQVDTPSSGTPSEPTTPEAPIGAQTAAAWGRTDSTQPQKRRPVGLVIGGVIALAAAVTAGVLLGGGSPEDSEGGTPVAESATAAARPNPEDVPPADVPAPAPASPVSSEVPADSSAEGATPEVSAPKDAPEAPSKEPPTATSPASTPAKAPAASPQSTPPRNTPPSPSKPAGSAPSSATKPAATATPTPPPAPAPAGGISDFGGRR